jgi:hypothetical protein
MYLRQKNQEIINRMYWTQWQLNTLLFTFQYIFIDIVINVAWVFYYTNVL